MTDLRHKSALVTGATSGIGKAIAIKLKSMGLEVYGTGRSQAALTELREEHGITPLQVDLCEPGAVEESLLGLDVDVLVNNAGALATMAPFPQVERDAIGTMLDVNMRAAITLTHAMLPRMMGQGHGHLFFTGSIAGGAPFPNMALYCSVKAAMRMFVDCLRCDIAGSGVRVTDIVPGRVKSQLYHDLLGKDQAQRALYDGHDVVAPEDIAQMLESILMMPEHVDVSRFEILPTAQYVGGGGMAAKA